MHRNSKKRLVTCGDIDLDVSRGDPNRCQSKSVMNMCPQGKSHAAQQLVPIEDIETEGDRQLKALLHKQLDTNISLDKQIRKRKLFTEPAIQKTTGEDAAGRRSLEVYKHLEEKESEVEQLRQCGLTETEIQIKLTADGQKNESSKKKRYGINPDAFKSQLDIIEEKILLRKAQLAKPDQFGGVKVMSRQAMDLEKALTRDREKSQMLGCLMTEGSEEAADFMGPEFSNKKHPINNLDSMWEDIVQSKRVEQDEDNNPLINSTWVPVEPKLNLQTLKNMHSSTANATPDDVLCDSGTADEETKKKSKKMRVLIGPVWKVPESEIIENRLSIEQIQELPRFKNYTPGTPSQTLYLKNLSDKVTEADLLGLFMQFKSRGDAEISIKLLTGRMRNQAFVQFEDIPTAEKAMSVINGYHLKEKPIIILYSNRSNTITEDR